MQERESTDIKVATWNIDGGLSDSVRAGSIAAKIQELDADVVVLPDMLDNTEAPVTELVHDLGYEKVVAPYVDSEPHPSAGSCIGMLVRQGLEARVHPIRLGNRNAIKAEVDVRGRERTIDVYGVRFDDRFPRMRKVMAAALLQDIRPDAPTIVAGDFECMNPDAFRAFMTGSRPVDWFSRRIPHSRTRQMSIRLAQWAQGEVFEVLESASLVDADMNYRATLRAGALPLAQLDHICYSLGKLNVRRFTPHPVPRFARLAISAELQLTDFLRYTGDL